MSLVDAHLHLPAYTDPEDVVGGAAATRMTLISCTVNPSEARLNLALRARHPGTIRCFIGVHPSDATEVSPSAELSEAWREADGIGEIGLDPKYSEVSEGSVQMAAFTDQLAVAERLGKPVQVHSRGSEKTCLEVMGSHSLGPVLMHWFESEEMLEESVRRGYYVSFGPAVIYSKKLRRMAVRYPPDLILTESDGPVRFGALEGRGGPGLVASVLFAIAEARREPFDSTLVTVGENARRFMRCKD